MGNFSTTSAPKVEKDLEKIAREIGPEISKYVEEDEITAGFHRLL